MAIELESQLEENFIDQLVGLDYERIQMRSASEVYSNFHQMLNKHNAHKLTTPITDTEFKRFLRHIGKKSVYDSAEILRAKQLLERDDGTKEYVELFNTQEWEKNHFQVANQVQDEGIHKGRYDVTIFVNGLPLVQIELKRRGIDFKEAFNQIARYKLHNFGGLFGFVQLFIVSNGVTTKYFANKDGKLEFSQTFYWTDKDNQRITNLYDFTEAFLNPMQLAKVISRFMILNKSIRTLMVMRPYQIYAVEALVQQARETQGNGFIWHTTGSGKTLTSFKAAQILSNESDIDLVFFLVDRTDLDTQTLEEFNKWHPDSVDTTTNTRTLVKQIDEGGNPLIITTMQKMNTAVKTDSHREVMEKYRDQRVIFIMDECHRTQFGEMHNNVKAFFRNAQYFGFTGTPILASSNNNRTTADIFGDMLHPYLIKNAIHDGNVLGFSVSYWETMKHKDPASAENVKNLNKKEAFESPERIELIVDHILSHHHQLTRNKEYTSMLATPSIGILTLYYDLFKKKDHDLTIAAVFSYGENEDMEERDEHSKDVMARMLTDYNDRFGTNYKLETYSAYQKNVSERVKSTQIDILLVVNKFLTGFDSKMLNTLYVDKNLESHNLIQAYSRTNRIAGSTKPFGNIIVYRPLKEKTDEAIRSYSSVEHANEVLMKSYSEYLKEFEKSVKAMREVAETPQVIDSMMDEEEQKKFIQKFREVMKLVRTLENFTDFDPDESLPGFNESEFIDYKSKYLEIYDRMRGETGGNEGSSILNDINFEIELFKKDKINVHYILNLLKAVDFTDKDALSKQADEIEKVLNTATDDSLRLKANLIRRFVRDVVPNLKSEDEVDAEYDRYEDQVRLQEIADFAQSYKVSPEQLKKFINETNFSGTLPLKKIKSSFTAPSYKEKSLISGKISGFIQNHIQKYF